MRIGIGLFWDDGSEKVSHGDAGLDKTGWGGR